MYEGLLFLHVVGALTLFGALALELTGAWRLLQVGTVAEARTWTGLISGTSRVHPVATLLLLVAGLGMTFDAWSLTTPWVLVSLVAFFLLATVGSMVLAARWKAVGEAAAATPDGPLPASLRVRAVDPGLWGLMHGMVGASVGIVAMMTVKPGWAGSVAMLAVGTGVGVLLGVGAARATLAGRGPVRRRGVG